MDVELLSKMVGELVLDHDQVGLPGVGTFVAEVVPASFSDKGYTINPPYRRLSFTSARLEEDLLVDFYAAQNPGVDRTKARAYLTAFLAELKAILEDRKTIGLPGLGRLRATRQNAFFFVPNEDLDIYPEGFGLASVSLKTHQETDEEVSIAVEDLASILSSIPAEEPEASIAEEPVASAAEEPEAAAPAGDAGAPESGAEVTESVAGIEQTPASAGDAAVAAEEKAEPAFLAPGRVTRHHQHSGEYRNHRHHHHHGGGHHHRHHVKWWIWPLVLLGLAIVLLIAFVVLAQVAPDFIDSILYTEEELRIINYSIINY